MSPTRREFIQAGAATALVTAGLGNGSAHGQESAGHPELVLHNGKITTHDGKQPEVTAIAIAKGNISAIGSDGDILSLAGDTTQTIDLNERRVIPGLNDSHLHVIRAGLFYNLELRWDGVPSISQALDQLRVQAENTPPPQWVRIIGGWNEWQFAEGRMPVAADRTIRMTTPSSKNSTKTATSRFALPIVCLLRSRAANWRIMSAGSG